MGVIFIFWAIISPQSLSYQLRNWLEEAAQTTIEQSSEDTIQPINPSTYSEKHQTLVHR